MVTAAHPFDPALMAAANICPVTGLATDYLNHFNEIAMLVDMAGDMPDAVDEILAWRPRSYRDHFHLTGFRERELAIEAYEACPPSMRAPFDEACAAIADAILQIQDELSAGVTDPADLPGRAANLYDLIGAANGCILGRDAPDSSSEQAAIDALFD
jgi:hypothetical protein